MSAMTREQILEELRIILNDTFEIAPEKVTPEAHLFTDLELDSIDAVDLAIKLQQLTGKRIKPDEFKTVRTVGDVIDAAEALLAAA
jgi:acyl carrier protein